MHLLCAFFIGFRAEPLLLFGFAFEMNRLEIDLAYDAVHAITGLSKQIICLVVSLDQCEVTNNRLVHHCLTVGNPRRSRQCLK